MTTYKFLASDSASAMEEVVKKLGPDALIISTSKRGNKVEIEATFDGYFPPDESGENNTFEFEDKFKVSWKLTDKVRIYNIGEISKIQGKDYYKAKIGFEYSL